MTKQCLQYNGSDTTENNKMLEAPELWLFVYISIFHTKKSQLGCLETSWDFVFWGTQSTVQGEGGILLNITKQSLYCSDLVWKLSSTDEEVDRMCPRSVSFHFWRFLWDLNWLLQHVLQVLLKIQTHSLKNDNSTVMPQSIIINHTLIQNMSN